MTIEDDDARLHDCNETELLLMAHAQGLGRLKRGLPRTLLLSFVRGEADPEPEDMSDTIHTRKILQKFIMDHWAKARSQLPGCDGCCTTYPCSEGRHALCYFPNKEQAAIK